MVQSHLYFAGACEEALTFYTSALKAERELLIRYKDSPEPLPPEMIPSGWEDKVLHATIKIGDTAISASDDPTKGEFGGFSLMVSLPTEGEVDHAFAALAESGTVTLPLGRTFWSQRFGMVTDRFGVGWMIRIAPN